MDAKRPIIDAKTAPVDPTCIFCKIAAGQIPCHKIYEDNVVMAFLDVGPIVCGHCLVIPKGHYPNVVETPPEVLAEVNARIPALAKAILSATGTVACHVLTNSGAEAMQSVQHLHYHILPRRPGDNLHIPWPATKIDSTAAAALKTAIIDALGRPS